ncbi:MAG: DMT family transporter [Bacteroidaceae bacterium]|nr:DMT family transporter [Bacteroidaceae bacterium]MBR5891407.1 DMT family transporter [Bacteroidaceae bacterium]
MEKVVNKGGVVLACVTAFFVVCIWGTTFVQTKVLINAGLTPEEIFFFRFVLAYVMIVPFAGRRLFMNSVRDELVAIALGLTGGSLYFITENTALIYGYCSNVSLLVCVTPLTTAFLMGWLYPSERMNRKALLGSCVALFGVALVVFNGNFVLKLSPLADGLAFAACLCWTFYSVLMKYIQPRYGTLFIMRKVFGYGLLTIMPMFIGNMPRWDMVIDGGAAVWGNVLMLGCVASMLCFTLWNYVLDRLGTVRATNFIYFNPVVTMAASWLVLDECITWIALLGACLVLVGMYCAERCRTK